MIDHPHLSTEQLAERWGISADTIQRRIASGQLAAINVGGGRRPRWRIPAEAIARYETRHASRAEPRMTRIRRRRSPDVIEFF